MPILCLNLLIEPFISQQRFSRRPIPPIEYHDLTYELFILLAHFSLSSPMKRRKFRLGDLLHKVQNAHDRLWASNFLVLGGEWTKILILSFENFKIILFVTVRYIAGTEEVEIATVDKTYEL